MDVQVGVQKARQIAAQHGLKYIPVHHMEAHALIARAGTAVQFPYLCLLVSGGHNMIVIVEGVGAYTLLGSTLDDAVGENLTLCDILTGRCVLCKVMTTFKVGPGVYHKTSDGPNAALM